MESHHALRTLQKKRTTNFREDETKLLIQLWGNPQIQNKLYLTHRKAPVMRILAANMQRHGFYRTPDEIKTRIRNLKCLYHRIKRTVQSGTGLGTVDPDWPHYKAMDAILCKEMLKKDNLYNENILEGPRCEDIKQEVEDIEINDDMESFTTTSNQGSEFGDDTTNPLPSLTPAPQNEETTPTKTPSVLPTILPNLTNFAIPIQTQQAMSPQNGTTPRPNGVPSLPFPLLIVQQKPQVNGNEKNANKTPNLATIQTLQSLTQQTQYNSNPGEISTVLKELLDVQKENLAVEKQRLELEKERLEYNKNIGNQLLPLIPIFGGLLQKLFFKNGESSAIETPSPKNGKKRKCNSSDDILRESKILRTVLEKNIKKYMLGDDYHDDSDEKDDSGVGINEEEPKKRK